MSSCGRRSLTGASQNQTSVLNLCHLYACHPEEGVSCPTKDLCNSAANRRLGWLSPHERRMPQRKHLDWRASLLLRNPNRPRSLRIPRSSGPADQQVNWNSQEDDEQSRPRCRRSVCEQYGKNCAGAKNVQGWDYRPATTWPGLLIVLLGVPIYLLIRWAARAQAVTSEFQAADVQNSE